MRHKFCYLKKPTQRSISRTADLLTYYLSCISIIFYLSKHVQFSFNNSDSTTLFNSLLYADHWNREHSNKSCNTNSNRSLVPFGKKNTILLIFGISSIPSQRSNILFTLSIDGDPSLYLYISVHSSIFIITGWWNTTVYEWYCIYYNFFDTDNWRVQSGF